MYLLENEYTYVKVVKTKSGYYFFEFITTATSLADSLLHTSHTMVCFKHTDDHTPHICSSPYQCCLSTLYVLHHGSCPDKFYISSGYYHLEVMAGFPVLSRP